MTIAITGAAGHLGRLTAQLVLDRVPPGEVVLVTRRPDAIADLADAGAIVRHGDFDEPASLPAAFAGVDRLLLDQHRRPRQPGGPAHRRHRCRGGGRRRPRDLHLGRQRRQRAAAAWSPTSTARPSRRSATAACAGPRCATGCTPSSRSPPRRAPSPSGQLVHNNGDGAHRLRLARGLRRGRRGRAHRPTATRTASTTSRAPSSSRRRSSPRSSPTSPAAPSTAVAIDDDAATRASSPSACRPRPRRPTPRSARPSAKVCWMS